MKLRTTWILLAVTTAAALYYFAIEQPRHRRQLHDLQSEARVTKIPVDDVTGLVIERTGTTLRFVRSGGEWRMTAPVEDRAEAARVNVLLRTLTGATIERRLGAPLAALSEYGLAPPAAVVRIATVTDTLVLEIGDFNMTRSSCYVRRGGSDEVLLIAAGLRRYAHSSVFVYRDKKVAFFPVADVSRLELLSPKRGFSWWKTEGDSWLSMAGADTIRGETDEIVGILRSLRAMRADSLFEITGESSVGLFSNSPGRVTLDVGTDSNTTYVFGSDGSGACYVRDGSGQRIARVDPVILSVFSKTLHDLRDRRVVHFMADSLSRIELEASGRSGSIVRPDAEWGFVNPELGVIDQSAVGAFLKLLKEFKFREIIAERITSPRAHGLDVPSFRLTLYDRRGAVVDRFVAGDIVEVRQVRLATNRSTGHLGAVDAEPVAELVSRFEGFRVQ